MKVGYAINLLQKLNPEADLKLHGPEGESVLFAVAMAKDDSPVWLECESDVDLGEEIAARLQHAKEIGTSKEDFFKELFETGITIEMVKKYSGEEMAQEMCEVCKKTGLL